MNESWEQALTGFMATHGVPPKASRRLRLALTHSSWSHEQGAGIPDNQRLEYLGDSVLGLIINRYLFESFPKYDEGQLSRIKSVVVAEPALARIAQGLGLGQLLLLGKGEEKAGGRSRPSNLADALEALIAALYLDCGLGFATDFVLKHFYEVLEKTTDPRQARDHKTSLQELAQSKGRGLPEYRVLGSSGPDHQKIFEVSVSIDGTELARAKGSSIKKAQMAAARKALSVL